MNYSKMQKFSAQKQQAAYNTANAQYQQAQQHKETLRQQQQLQQQQRQVQQQQQQQQQAQQYQQQAQQAQQAQQQRQMVETMNGSDCLFDKDFWTDLAIGMGILLAGLTMIGFLVFAVVLM